MARARLFLLLFVFTLFPALAALADQDFRADLTGKNEVPRVKTPATGRLDLTLSNNVLSFQLRVDNITSPTAANIHRGKPGQNGPPVAGLFGGPVKTGPFSGPLSAGTISDATLIGELHGKSVADLLRLIKSGNAYVNVLSSTYPAGEIRGKIRAK
jgi:hypothetical protein